MYKIFLYQNGKSVVQYQSDFVPEVGDRISGLGIPDHQLRVVVGRALILNTNIINIEVEYAFPALVPKESIEEAVNY